AGGPPEGYCARASGPDCRAPARRRPPADTPPAAAAPAAPKPPTLSPPQRLSSRRAPSAGAPARVSVPVSSTSLCPSYSQGDIFTGQLRGDRITERSHKRARLLTAACSGATILQSMKKAVGANRDKAEQR